MHHSCRQGDPNSLEPSNRLLRYETSPHFGKRGRVRTLDDDDLRRSSVHKTAQGTRVPTQYGNHTPFIPNLLTRTAFP
jgi:hypothetical protein